MTRIKSLLLAAILAFTLVFAVGCSNSAYDIAVKNGYQGTEEQWLNSLNGMDGSDLTIRDIYDEAVKSGYEGDFLDFLHDFMSFEQSADNTAAINKGLKSAMLIRCAFTKRNAGFLESSEYTQSGAGVIYKINKELGLAYIITNYHVVYSSTANTSNRISDSITATPYGGSAISVTYVGGSATYDIAVLMAQSSYLSSDVPIAVTVANYDPIVGQTAIAIGNPAGEGISATEGIVSVDSETIIMEDIENSSSYVSMRVVRIDAPVNSGNSGGGLFDASGALIGIVNAKSSDDSIENMAYAIPVNIATAVADNIIDDGTFSKGTMGITIKTTDSKAYLDSDGYVKISETVTIDSVSGAAQGILKKGDIALSITVGGVETQITRQFHLTDPLLYTKAGDTVTIKVLRDEQEITLDIVLA